MGVANASQSQVGDLGHNVNSSYFNTGYDKDFDSSLYTDLI